MLQLKHISWPRALFVGFVALLITTTAGAAEKSQDQVVAELSANNGTVPPGWVSLTGDTTEQQPTSNIVNHPPPPITDKHAFYPNLGAFNDVHNPTGTELSSENWEAGIVSGSYAYCGNTWVDIYGDAWCFNPNTVAAGITMREYPYRNSNYSKLLHSATFINSTSKGIVANYFVDGVRYFFDDPRGRGNSIKVTAVSGQVINMYNTAGVEATLILDDGSEISRDHDNPGGGGIFLGACVLPPREIVEVHMQGGSIEEMDDIQFGDYGECIIPPPPLNIDDIHTGLDILEFKLDTLLGGTNLAGGSARRR